MPVHTDVLVWQNHAFESDIPRVNLGFPLVLYSPREGYEGFKRFRHVNNDKRLFNQKAIHQRLYTITTLRG